MERQYLTLGDLKKAIDDHVEERFNDLLQIESEKEDPSGPPDENTEAYEAYNRFITDLGNTPYLSYKDYFEDAMKDDVLAKDAKLVGMLNAFVDTYQNTFPEGADNFLFKHIQNNYHLSEMDDQRISKNNLTEIVNTPNKNDGKTPLLSAIELKRNDHVKWLIDKGADPFNVKLALPILQAAIKSKDPKIIMEIGKKYEKENLTKKLFENLIKLNDQGQKDAIQTFVDLGYSQNSRVPDKHIKMAEQLNNPLLLQRLKKKNQREEKRTVISQGSLFYHSVSKPITPIQAVLSQTYLANNPENFVVAKGLTSFSQEELLKPFFKVLGLAALGKHDASQTKSSARFKIIGGDDVEKFAGKKEADKYHGYYSHKSSVFVETNNAANEISSIIMHESAHFATNEIFKNDSYPYAKDPEGAKDKERFQQVKKDIIEKIENTNKSNLSSVEVDTMKRFESVVKHYDEKDWDAEFIVKVHEVIGGIGIKEGTAFLEKYTPSLLDYYKEVFNPACEKYLKEHQAELYLTDEKPTVALRNANP